MRTEKFNSDKEYWEGDDIGNALHYHPQELLSYKDIDVIIAEVCGANDEASWHWIIQRKDGKFVYVSGGCDYTGWDCRSGADSKGPFDNAEDAINSVEEKDDYNRYIRQALLRQLNGTLPFAIYQHPV